MKKLILLITLTLLTVSGFGQTLRATAAKLNITSLAPTTQEEYNYASKGLKMQRAQGLDMKAGYILANKNEMKVGGLNVVMESLVRKADQSLACIIVQIENPKLSEPLYLAIPNASTDGGIFGQYAKAIAALDSGSARVVLYCVSARLSGMETIVVKSVR